ncbi:restriction endonuclease [Nonomuraea sp. NBC_01738]|uniref:restriction endonuclease n=1 Tax=Nonomuraea sp. NBC_01738 TaxID=2976003 RepID=UPI002E13ED17|nr:restriction endonuclease [Nonomuraea sp. NBC_01738]
MAALAAAGAAIWALITIVQVTVAFVLAHHTTILAFVFVALLVAGVTGITRAVAGHERRLLRERVHAHARLEKVDAMTGTEFEHFIADLLRTTGFHDVSVTGRSGDRGVDITASSPTGTRVAVQCKRQSGPVRADRVRNLVGAVHCTYLDHHPVLITNASFTGPALGEASGLVTMIDRERLRAWFAGSPPKLEK